MIKTLLLFLIMLSVIITIHEAGHLFAAKKFGVYCYEFSFGMGPILWKKKKGETQYSIRAIPIGGFVSMAGEVDGDEAYPDVVVPDDRRIIHKPWWQRVIIMLAGVFMNFVLAFLIFSLTVLANGGYYETPKAEVGRVVENSPAEKAGFEQGDIIVAVTDENGKTVHPEYFTDLSSLSMDGSPMTYTLERDGKQFDVRVTPELDEDSQTYRIGIQAPEYTFQKVNALSCWKVGAQDMGMLFKGTVEAFGQLFTRAGIKNLSGPVGIYQATETYSSMGFLSYLLLVAQISFSVGFFNLLPLPVLDGGQVVLTVFEAIFHRELNQKVKIGIMLACWAVLITLMLTVTWNDIAKLIAR